MSHRLVPVREARGEFPFKGSPAEGGDEGGGKNPFPRMSLHLAGERLSTGEQYRAQAEEQLLRFARDRTPPETKAVICNVAAWAGVAVYGALILIASFCDLPVWARITVIVCAFLGVAAVIAPILVVAVDTEIFTCPKCNKEFVPTLTAYLFAPHTIKRRYLKCPYCSRKSWCISRLRSSAASPRAGREESDQ